MTVRRFPLPWSARFCPAQATKSMPPMAVFTGSRCARAIPSGAPLNFSERRGGLRRILPSYRSRCASERVAVSMDYEIIVIVMRSRRPLRASHHHWCIVSRTSERASRNECSDANPCSDTNHDQRDDSDGQQGSLVHVNSPQHPARMQRNLIRALRV